MQYTKIQKILNENKDFFLALEEYDKTRQLPFHRKRIDVTLSVATINKLKNLKKRTGKSISKLIEEKFN
ncbi:hypothetical protein HY212_07770 [Candidatus Pacearchaeota archaeon]|nr:hypothetical protein [Candidatus Pacearchaeota archaeon]